jgi:hypothetical protein
LTTWTPELIARVEHERSMGLSHREIAKRHGLTRNQVIGKLWRLNGPDGIIGSHLKPARPDKQPWRDTHNVFEPYSEFKARKQRERDAARS